MTRGASQPRQPDHREVAAGINEVEGYLLARTEADNARIEAEAFADCLPWLLTAQRDDVVQRYTEARIASSLAQMRHISARCEELRGEYSRRYQSLRMRLLGAHLLVLSFAGAAVLIVLLHQHSPAR